MPSVKGFHNSCDMIFASEYFEHIINPISHLLELIKLQPKYFIVANTFGQRAVGHFDYYQLDGSMVSGKEISKVFNNTLRKSGYEKVETTLWNNRPMYWKKK
jgi:hypothetical protein